MNTDLTFRDPLLESTFVAQHAESQQNFEIQFHYARALAWAAVGVRAINIALSTGEPGRWLAALITILGAVTTVLPSFAHKLPKRLYLKWRPAIIMVDNVVQVLLGCYTHDTIYPETGVTSIFKSAFVLLSGNGIAWLLFSGLWGSLTFKYMFPQQACLTMILLVYNRTLCRRSAALVHAYESIKRAAAQQLGPLFSQGPFRQLLRLAEVVLAASHSSPDSDSAAAAAGAGAGGAACTDGGGVCSSPDWLTCLGGPGGEAGSAAGAAGGQCPAVDGERLCTIMQPFTQLLLGFLLPTLWIYAGELKARRKFARKVARSPAGRGADWDWLDHGLSVSLQDYFFFGLPAIACLYLYVVAAA